MNSYFPPIMSYDTHSEIEPLITTRPIKSFLIAQTDLVQRELVLQRGHLY